MTNVKTKGVPCQVGQITQAITNIRRAVEDGDMQAALAAYGQATLYLNGYARHYIAQCPRPTLEELL